MEEEVTARMEEATAREIDKVLRDTDMVAAAVLAEQRVIIT
jgi:hypothetical protein